MTFARLLSMRVVAKRMERPYRTALRQLLALHALDRERGEPLEWLVCLGSRARGRALRVNLTALQRLHPELFEQRYVTREEVDEHEARIASLERKVEALSAKGKVA